MVLTFLTFLMVCFHIFFIAKRFNDSFGQTINPSTPLRTSGSTTLTTGLSTPLWSPIYRRPISITIKVVVNLENMEAQFPISYCESMGIMAQEAKK
jgi:hypothetical protein